jgi:hypothetical protein
MNHKLREKWTLVIMFCLKTRTCRSLVCTEETRNDSATLISLHAKMRPPDIRNANGGPVVFWFERVETPLKVVR